ASTTKPKPMAMITQAFCTRRMAWSSRVGTAGHNQKSRREGGLVGIRHPLYTVTGAMTGEPLSGVPVPRILVVDDEPLISMLVEDWLTELGCEVVGPVRSAEDGLELANDRLDGAILDVNVAHGTCYSLANALHARGVPSPLPPAMAVWTRVRDSKTR